MQAGETPSMEMDGKAGDLLMDRRDFLGLLAGCAAMQAVPGSQNQPQEGSKVTDARRGAAPFSLRGVYFHDGFAAEPKSQAPLTWDHDTWRRQIDWLRACGINAVEFATMLEFNRIPSTKMERRKIADRLRILAYAHSVGMQFGYLLTNTVLSTVPADEAPGHQLQNRAVTLCPRIPGNFEKTVTIPKFYLETYRDADFFEEFAADWGGCNCGKCDVSDYLRYVRVLAERLGQLHPKAKLYADTWCIAFWRKDPLAHGWKEMFDNEIAGSRTVMAALPTLPANVHLALPCHHLYRPLAFQSYGGKQQTPVFPTEADVRQVRKAGREVLAWPHFVMDDDAFRAPAWGIVHSEVRYIRALLQTLRRIGVDRVMGNLYLPHLQLSNTFAYGQLLHDPDRDPRTVLQDFARLIARREDADKLTDVLTWVENNSYWQQQMPPDGRLPTLPCRLNRAEAGKIAHEIRPNAAPQLPLPVPAADWLHDLQRSLPRMDWAQ
jgi:hypothetical protein